MHLFGNTRQPLSRRRQRLIALLISVLILAAAAMDLLLLPPDVFEAAFYAIPVVIAAKYLSPRGVLVVAALAVFIDLLTALTEQPPARAWPFGALALIIVAILAVQLAVQRREAARRAREAQEAQKQLQAFLGMVSHDLRNLLTPALGNAQFLARRPSPQRAASEQAALERIVRSTRQMQRLIDDLLDAARIGSGHFEIRPEPMDLAATVRQVADQQQATTTRHHLSVETPPKVEGRWDRGRIAQLLNNLVSNAIKYSPQGGDVRVSVQARDGQATISVADQGPGISPELVSALFQPFSRLSEQGLISGTGLGLYIARAIVEGHGGAIWLESTPGQGTVFYFSLPLTKA